VSSKAPSGPITRGYKTERGSLLRHTITTNLSANPLRLSAIRVAALLLCSPDAIHRETVLLPRFSLVEKIVELIIQEIETVSPQGSTTVVSGGMEVETESSKRLSGQVSSLF
jgi:hypothetical protein